MAVAQSEIMKIMDFLGVSDQECEQQSFLFGQILIWFIFSPYQIRIDLLIIKTLIHLQAITIEQIGVDLKYIPMEQTDSYSKQTTVNIEHFDIAHLPALEHTQMITVKQTKPSQMLLYLITIYFLTVALFYLVVSLRKNRHIECQLQCDEVDLYCECYIKSRVGWSTPTYVELSWSASHRQMDQYQEMAINEAVIMDKQSSIVLQIESYSEINCFPNGCLTSVGIIQQSIADNSMFIIQFDDKIPVARKQHIKVLFREMDSSHPQVQTFAQLAINLFFAIVTGIMVFWRQKIDIEVAPPTKMHINHIIQYEQDFKVKMQIPEDIVALNKQLQTNRSRAIRFLLNRMNKNIPFQPINDQYSYQSPFSYTL